MAKAPAPAPSPVRASSPALPAAPPPPQPVPFADKDLGPDARTLGGYRPGDKTPVVIRETRILIIASRPPGGGFGFRRRRQFEFNDIPLITYYPED